MRGKSVYVLYLLVDFDNLDERIVGRMLADIVSHLINRAALNLKSEDIATCRWVCIRLYGGWYENNILTRRAQKLITEIPPSTELFNFRRDGHQYTWHVQVELATSLVSFPRVHLMDTFRRREKLTGIRVADPISAGCDPKLCRVLGIKELIRKNKCPDCGTPASKIIWIAEQKLVDVMLATDVMSLAMINDAISCVVSSDDDFWPVMFHVSCSDRRIYHMHCIPGRRLKYIYIRDAQPAYIEIPL